MTDDGEDENEAEADKESHSTINDL